MVAITWAPTFTVVTLNVAEVLLAITFTVAGTVADAELLDNVMTAPPGGAGPLMVTVAVGLLEPPWTVVSFRESAVTPSGGFTVITAL
jgi:hypothetical protein